MKKRLLILCPHPDDELLLAGSLIYTLRKKWDIKVAFLTNGDSIAKWGNMRIKEAIESLKVLGVNKKNIEFLGYGNNWCGGMHIYNLPEDKEVISCAGHRYTYSLEDHPEYCMRKEGKHHLYTRRNMKKDLETLILDMKADVIICVDFDYHPDHRALSLLFEEVMAQILKSEINYKPVILKKFAYAGNYHGKWDYYKSPLSATMKSNRYELLDDRYEMDNPAYTWKERIQLSICRRTRTRYISRNILYKAACKHKTQKMTEHVGQFANADIVYWQRRTDGIAYKANIKATSGNPSYVNDFKLIDSTNILRSGMKIEMLDNCVWIPDRDDTEKKLYIDFDCPMKVSKIYLYENFILGENILEAVLRFDTGKEIFIDYFNHCGKKTEVVFEPQGGVSHIEFQILSAEGKRYGLTEIEIYEEDNEQEIPFQTFSESKKKYKNIENRIDIAIEKALFHIDPIRDQDSRFYEWYQLLLKWDHAGKDRVADWLKKNGYLNVAIYGLGSLGRRIADDLMQGDINVRYAIDKMAGTLYAAFPVRSIDMLDEMPEVELVIVTISMQYENIKKALLSKSFTIKGIISLDELIDKVLETEGN